MSFPPATHLLSLTDSHGAPLAEYMYYPEQRILYVRWHGHLTGGEVIRGVQQGAQWREQLDYPLILNDKSDTSGDWSDALPWLQYEWLPRAVAGGIQAIAYILSPDLPAQVVSLEFVESVQPHLHVSLFTSEAEAQRWLAQH